MEITEIANSSPEILNGVITTVGKIGLWLQAIGILVVITILATIVNFLTNKKRLKEIIQIKSKVNSIEKKIDKLLKKEKKKN